MLITAGVLQDGRGMDPALVRERTLSNVRLLLGMAQIGDFGHIFRQARLPDWLADTRRQDYPPMAQTFVSGGMAQLGSEGVSIFYSRDKASAGHWGAGQFNRLMFKALAVELMAMA